MQDKICNYQTNIMSRIIIVFITIMLFFLFNMSALVFARNINNEIEKNDIKISYIYKTYSVKPGDSLYKIAIRFGVTVSKIMMENNLHSSLIFPGQKLTIPIQMEKENNKVIYTVKAGDSLYLISRKYNVSISNIKNTNNLQSDLILIGQKLEIPLVVNNFKTYQTISGNAVINNKTRGNGIMNQENTLNNKVFPLTDNSDLPAYEEREIIVKFKPVVNSQALDKLIKQNNLVSINSFDTVDGKVVKYRLPDSGNLKELIEEYNKREDVLWVEPNYIYYPTTIPQDKYYNQYQWNMVNINMEAGWDIIKGSEDVTVAVLDTGIIPDHPDLEANLLKGVDFVGGVKSYPVESYTVTDYDPTDETPYQQGGSHGTHVAGIIGAVTNNNQGVAGINWDVKILPIRALTRKGGSSWDIVEGIYYAIDQDVDIINMSFGSTHDSYLQKEAVQKAVAEGITVVAATGNEGSSEVYYPAAYPETIAVGATGKNNTKTAYSNYGPEVDIVAPGGDYGESVLSTWGYYRDGVAVSDYNGMIGTSMATPHVSGIVALLMANGLQEPDEIRKCLISTARDLGKQGKDNYYGYGLVDAYGALLDKKLVNIQVFAVQKNGDNLYPRSEIVEIDVNGSFTLRKIEGTVDYIIGWIDVNGNNVIDGGDYYGQDYFKKGSTNIDLYVSYLSKSNGYPLYNIVR